MDNNRPEGRKKRIEGTGSGLNRRGEGLNTGPVGSGNGFSPKKGENNVRPFKENDESGSYRGTRSGRSPILIIILLALLLFGGGGGALSGLFGGSGGQVTYVQPTPAPVQSTPKPSAVIQAPSAAMVSPGCTSGRMPTTVMRAFSPSCPPVRLFVGSDPSTSTSKMR